LLWAKKEKKDANDTYNYDDFRRRRLYDDDDDDASLALRSRLHSTRTNETCV